MKTLRRKARTSISGELLYIERPNTKRMDIIRAANDKECDYVVVLYVNNNAIPLETLNL